jgi:L-lactate dehydrogenase (cytochrome)
MLTLDLQVLGVRRRDAKNGLSVPPRLTLANALDVLGKPGWALGMLGTKRRSFGNLQGRLGGSEGLKTLTEWVAGQFDAGATWKDVAWVRAQWPGRLVLKGVLDVEDAREAVASGADAIVVSNHGGRQLDGAASTIAVLPEVVDAVQGRCPVLFDGGIQSGQDLLKALALGAQGGLIGKAFLYGLASLALVGKCDVRDVDRGILRAARA